MEKTKKTKTTIWQIDDAVVRATSLACNNPLNKTGIVLMAKCVDLNEKI